MGGVAVQPGAVAGLVEIDQRFRQNLDICGGQVHALGPGGWHDVCGIAGKMQAAIAHGFSHKAAQGCDGFLD